MINFSSLATQTWEAADVRKKLDRMLLIFYGWEPLQRMAEIQDTRGGSVDSR